MFPGFLGGVASENGEKVTVWGGPTNVMILKDASNPLLIKFYGMSGGAG